MQSPCVQALSLSVHLGWPSYPHPMMLCFTMQKQPGLETAGHNKRSCSNFFCQVFSTSNRKVWLIQSLDLNSPFFFSYSFLSEWEWPKHIILGRVQASRRREMKMERAHHMFWSSPFRLSHCLLPGWYFQVLGMCWTKVHQSYFSLSLALLSLRYMVQNRTQRETPWSYVSWGYPNFVLLAPQLWKDSCLSIST